MCFLPPRSTLFPYTTLFRSGTGHFNFGRNVGEIGVSDGSPEPVHLSQDRKSTRLNSSHVKISYAVFCLKKKKWSEANNDDVTRSVTVQGGLTSLINVHGADA